MNILEPKPSAQGFPSNNEVYNAVEKRAFRDLALQSSLYPPDVQFRDRKNRKMLKPEGRGQNAAVFKLLVGDTATAVRVYLMGSHAQRSQTHYQFLEEYFARIKERPSWLVSFRHHSDELEVNGNRYPILTMEWLQGQQLGEWVVERVEAGDQAALREMADRWIDLIEELKRFEVGHGDLQHENILVVNGKLQLIDYDGMWVPGYVGEEAGEQGKPAYQHPQRNGQKMSPDIDNFSAWIILLALRGLASDLTLWQRHVENDADFPLLFTDDAAHSARLWDDLCRSPDAEVQEWAQKLHACLALSFDEIPPFECHRKAKQWNASLGELEAAAGNSSQLIALWDRHEQMLGGVKKAQVYGRLAALYQAVTLSPPSEEAIVTAWDDLQATGGHPAAGRYRERAKTARKLTEARAAVARILAELETVAQSPPSEELDRELCEIWERNKLDGRPEAKPFHACYQAAQQRENDRLAQRHFAATLSQLHSLTAPPRNEVADQKLVDAWTKARLSDCPAAAAFAEHYEGACNRLAAVRKVHQLASAGADPNLLLEAAESLPRNYPHKFRAEVLRAKLEVALAAEPRSDIVIANVWVKCLEAKAVPVGYANRQLCETAVSRWKCLKELTELNRTLPRDEQDQLWQKIYDRELLADCPDALRFQQEDREVRERLKLWEEWEDASAQGDVLRMLALSLHSKLAGYPPMERARFEYNQQLERGMKAKRLLRVLGSADDKAVSTFLDLSLLSGNLSREFRPFQERLLRIIENALTERPPLPASPPYQVNTETDQITLRWAGWEWPLFGLPDRQCRVAFHSSRFLESPTDDANGTYRPTQRNCRSGGYTLPIPQGVQQVFVTVWPVVAVDRALFGQREVVGPPLHIGPIILKSEKGRRWLRSLWG